MAGVETSTLGYVETTDGNILYVYLVRLLVHYLRSEPGRAARDERTPVSPAAPAGTMSNSFHAKVIRYLYATRAELPAPTTTLAKCFRFAHPAEAKQSSESRAQRPETIRKVSEKLIGML